MMPFDEQPAQGVTPPVEKGIPMPDLRRGRPTIYPWASMEVGDSFAVPFESDVQRNGLSRTASQQASRHGGKYATRTLMKGGQKIIRIWRTA